MSRVVFAGSCSTVRAVSSALRPRPCPVIVANLTLQLSMSSLQQRDCVDSVEVFTLRAPLGKARFWSSQSAFPERNSLLVRVTCGEFEVGGLAGAPGASGAGLGRGRAVRAARAGGGRYRASPRSPGPGPANPASSHQVGCADTQPGFTHLYSEQLYSFSRDFGQRGTYVEAISGIDVALWDLLGRMLGVPVCRLLGGAHRSRVQVYATGCYYRHDSQDPAAINTEQSVAEAATEAAGFKVSRPGYCQLCDVCGGCGVPGGQDEGGAAEGGTRPPAGGRGPGGTRARPQV